MKILWITNIPFAKLSGLAGLNSGNTTGSWLDASLDAFIGDKEYEIIVATIGNTDKIRTLVEGNITYCLLPGGSVSKYNYKSRSNREVWELIRNTYKPDFLQQAMADNFQVLSLNTNSSVHHNSIEKQREWVLAQIKAFPGQIAFATTFTIEGWDDPGWAEKTIAHLDKTIAQGAVAVKIWKNIGMVEKDKQGRLIMIDNPRFDPIFEYLIQKGIPIVGQLG